MGETGIGKTVLIKFLCAIMGVEYEIHNINAGVKQSELIAIISRANYKLDSNEIP